MCAFSQYAATDCCTKPTECCTETYSLVPFVLSTPHWGIRRESTGEERDEVKSSRDKKKMQGTNRPRTRERREKVINGMETNKANKK